MEYLVALGYCPLMCGNEKILDFNTFMIEYHKEQLELEDLDFLFGSNMDEIEKWNNGFENKELIQLLNKISRCKK